MEPKTLQLPVAIISNNDIARVLRELETLDEFLVQSQIRDQTAAQLPGVSALLEALAKANAVNLLEDRARAHLQALLTTLQQQAPVVHLSFAAEPPSQFLERLAQWFRAEVHPQTLLQIGLQPSIAAGCILRTTNKFFDFSLGARLKSQQDQLIAELQEKR